jgi:hypothetical protein
MRLIGWIAAIVVVGSLGSDAFGIELCCDRYRAPANAESCTAYGAPACAAPGLGLVPGCCEFVPSCCDDVWEGYCQEQRGLSGRFAGRLCLPRLRCRTICAPPACGTSCCQPDQGPAPILQEETTAPAEQPIPPAPKSPSA